MPTEWQCLLKGLLERDYYKRWDEARILRWLVENETGAVQKQSSWVRRVILTATAVLIIGFAGAVGTGIWQVTQAQRESSTLSASSSAKPVEQPSGSIKKLLITESLDLKASPWFRLGISALVWLIAIALLLAGFGHCISGTPHGFIFICGGIAVAGIAIILA